MICSGICQIALSQNEKMEIDGAVIIANNDDQNPKAGTIRWTGQDFQGFDGNQWLSLICECDDVVDPPSCPDIRYVTHNIENTTQSSIRIRVETIQNLPLRIYYYPSSNPNQIVYRGCEATANYGANGNEHVQNITGLNASTEYTLIIQTSQDVGNNSSDCDGMTWEDISCPITVSTD